MPIWLRTFTFNKLKEYFNNQSEAYKKIENKVSKNTPTGPAIKTPTYSSKVKK